jgi:hypothetical protein
MENSPSRLLSVKQVGGLIVLLFTLYLTQLAVNVAIDSIQMDKRAGVGIGNIEILSEMTAGKPLKIRARTTNSGESPAVHASVTGYMDFLVRPKDEGIPLSEDPIGKTHQDVDFVPSCFFLSLDGRGYRRGRTPLVPPLSSSLPPGERESNIRPHRLYTPHLAVAFL